MNRDELLEAVYEVPVDDLSPVASELTTTEPDEENPQVVHTRAALGLDYRRVILRDSTSPGAGVSVAATAMTVAVIVYLAVDPDHRGRGYARGLVELAREQAETHRTIDYCCVRAPAEVVPFFERLGYRHPDGSPPGFLVLALREGVEWPPGAVQPHGW